MGRMTKVPPSVTLKHQPYRHVDHLELMAVEEVQQFVHHWRFDLEMNVQRTGWMYGYYREDTHYPLGIRAVCEAIYEPPQVDVEGVARFLPDPSLPTADALAQRLGLERIGCIFTHLPRQELLQPHEILRLCKLQLESLRGRPEHFTGYGASKFITCTVALDANRNGEPTPNAFMVSDMGMALVRDGLIAEEQPDPSLLRLRAPLPNELLPLVLESGHEKNQFDSDWFLVRVNESAPKKVRCFFKLGHFPRENRHGQEQTPRMIKDFFRHPAIRGIDAKSSWLRFSDFHLLLYVAKLFDLDTAFALCDAIKNEEPVDRNLEDVLTSIA
eukprot:GHVT01032823.1.p1 GENE.GHVT01032823.1~~GHVT01032823.1.p1  ORF type:complete len:328 (+),score=48.47 GHVT01032823.1:610-1593(+)